jgi:hypothetical protein
MKSFWGAKHLVGLCALALAPSALAGQILCQVSPENPTVILGLLGIAAAAYPVASKHARTLFKRKDSAAKTEDSA